MIGYSEIIPLDMSLSITLLSEFKHLRTIQERPPTSKETEKTTPQPSEMPCVLETNTPSLVSLRERLPGTQKWYHGNSRVPPSVLPPPGKEGLVTPNPSGLLPVTDPPLDEANHHWVYWKQQHGLLQGTCEIKNNTVFASRISIHAWQDWILWFR